MSSDTGAVDDDKNSTDEIPAKRVRVESADLSNRAIVSIHANHPPPPPPPFISPVEESRRRCTLYRLLTDNTCVEELKDMVIVAKDCLVQQGIRPINTPDENDAAEEIALHSRLQTDKYRLVFKRAYILLVLSVCPIFFNTLVNQYAVNAERLDKFAGSPTSDFSLDCQMYITGPIRNADMFVTRALVKWTQEGNT